MSYTPVSSADGEAQFTATSSIKAPLWPPVWVVRWNLKFLGPPSYRPIPRDCGSKEPVPVRLPTAPENVPIEFQVPSWDCTSTLSESSAGSVSKMSVKSNVQACRPVKSMGAGVSAQESVPAG